VISFLFSPFFIHAADPLPAHVPAAALSPAVKHVTNLSEFSVNAILFTCWEIIILYNNPVFNKQLTVLTVYMIFPLT